MQIALEQYRALSVTEQGHVDARIEQLLEQPEGPRAAYDVQSDQWTTTFGDGAGLLLYAVVPQHQQMIVLRLVLL